MCYQVINTPIYGGMEKTEMKLKLIDNEYCENDLEIGQIFEIDKEKDIMVVYGDEIKSVAYGNLVGLLIEAIKDLKGEISELKEKVAKLEDSK